MPANREAAEQPARATVRGIDAKESGVDTGEFERHNIRKKRFSRAALKDKADHTSSARHRMGFLQDWFNGEAKKSYESATKRAAAFEEQLETHQKHMADE